MSDIEKVLEERGSRYGDFNEHARITQGIKMYMGSGCNWDICTAPMKETLEMLAHKIGRIVNGDPYYADSWTDIIGYTRLVEKTLLKEAPMPPKLFTEEDLDKLTPGQVIEVDKYGKPFQAYAGTFPESAREPYLPYGTLTKLREDIMAFQESVYDPKNTKGAPIKLTEAVQLLWRVAAELKNL